MYSKTSRGRLVNTSLTKLIIRLHEQGYTEDFSVALVRKESIILCHENGSFEMDSFEISMISQFFDILNSQYIYLHAVEAPCGLKGIVLFNAVLFANNAQCVLMKNMHSGQAGERFQDWQYRTAI